MKEIISKTEGVTISVHTSLTPGFPLVALVMEENGEEYSVVLEHKSEVEAVIKALQNYLDLWDADQPDTEPKGEYMLRVRFKANGDDYRPVKWPVKHPYWCSGYSGDNSIVISYADDVDYIYEHWPEAEDLDIDEVEDYVFTDRFPVPEWWEA